MRFEPWRCNCPCPIFQVWDPAAHADGCGVFVPDRLHADEGGSD